jgi:hypothetical protein
MVKNLAKEGERPSGRDKLQVALRVSKTAAGDVRKKREGPTMSKHSLAVKYMEFDHDNQRRMSYKQKKVTLNHTIKQD